MFKNISIKTKISVLFLISLLLMGGISFWVQKTSLQKVQSLQTNRYISYAKELFSLLSKEKTTQIKIRLKELGLQEIKDSNIIKNGSIILSKRYTFGALKIIKKMDSYYLYIRYLNRKLLLYDISQDEIKKERYVTNFLVLLDVFLMIVIYFIIIKMLSPLKVIVKKMKSFSKGNLSTRIEVKNNDEIGEVAENFNSMAKSLQEAINSKQELLRDVGHELKTPIAKGKFLVEKLNDKEIKSDISKIFEDLDMLTSEIVESQMLEKDELNLETFKVQTLIAESLSKLYIEDFEDIKIDIEDFKITGDLYYLSKMLKNLLDNALKYSVKKPIMLIVKDGSMSVESYGERLDDVENYFKDFNQKDKNSKGFGLGLGIVRKIARKHGFLIRYSYKNRRNCFTVLFQN